MTAEKSSTRLADAGLGQRRRHMVGFFDYPTIATGGWRRLRLTGQLRLQCISSPEMTLGVADGSLSREALYLGARENRKLGMQRRARRELALDLDCPDQQFPLR
jgi:hypothetical protein